MLYAGRLSITVPQELYENRRDRLKKLIDLGAPPQIIGMEARLLAECFHYSTTDRLRQWLLNRTPRWLLWLTSRTYRNMEREGFGDVRRCPNCRKELSDDEASGEQCAVCRPTSIF